MDREGVLIKTIVLNMFCSILLFYVMKLIIRETETYPKSHGIELYQLGMLLAACSSEVAELANNRLIETYANEELVSRNKKLRHRPLGTDSMCIPVMHQWPRLFMFSILSSPLSPHPSQKAGAFILMAEYGCCCSIPYIHVPGGKKREG